MGENGSDCLHCFDTVGWSSERESGLQKNLVTKGFRRVTCQEMAL